MKYTSNINGFEIIVEETNNNKRDTLIFIHGLFSSGKFIHGMEKLKNNFNIITFSFPGKTNAKIRVKEYIEVAEEVLKRVKHSKVHIVAHSMGGFVASSLASSKKVKSIELIAPVNPFMAKTNIYKRLSSVINPNTVKEKMLSGLIKGGTMSIDAISKNGLSNFISSKNVWSDVVKYDLLDESFIVDKLHNNYSKNSKKLSFVGGENDPLIQIDMLKEYAKSIGKDVTVIPDSGHNPFKGTKETYKYLNSKYPPREKIFKVKNIYKNK